METLSVDGDMSVTLNTPQCDLNYSGCTTSATTAYRVHDCAFYYSCDNCSGQMMETMIRSFHKFEDMYCKRCNRKYGIQGYVEVIPLGGK